MPPANLHEAVQPNFLTECYAAACQSLIDDFNITNEQAAQRLNTFWLNQNALDREEWDARIWAEVALAREHEEQQHAKAEEQHR